MASSTAESKVLKKITEYLDELHKAGHKIYYERRQAGGFNYKHGLPDLFLVYNGIHIEIETKQPEGDTRADQEKWERRFKQEGTLYIRPDSVKEFKAFMEEKIIPNLK